MDATTTRSSRKLAAVAVATLALLAAACSSGDDGKATTTTKAAEPALPTTKIATQATDSAVAALVPAAIKSAGPLTIATDASYPPDELVAPNGDLVGMDIDLGNALLQVMGLKGTFKNATFDTIIPGIESGKFAIGLSSFTDTAAREKQVDFVNYFQAGEGFYVKSGATKSFDGLASLCGAKVAVESGTIEETDAKTQSTACTKAGKDKVTVLTFSDQSQTNLAVSSGRADVGFGDSQVVGWIVATSKGQFKLSGKPFAVAPYGIALPKGNGMTAPVKAALEKLIANGTYAKILAKWGVSDGAISTVTLNGAGSAS